jgi:hypothetical protein
MATLDAYVADVRRYTRGDELVTVTDIVAFLNEGLVDLAARLELFEREVLDTTDGTAFIAFPTSLDGVVRIIALELGDGYVDDVVWTSRADFDLVRDTDSTPGLVLGHVFNERIELYPTPATGTPYRLTYKRLPTMPDSGDDDVGVPPELERKLREYATWKALMKLGRLEDALVWHQLYEDGLPVPALARKRTLPGPLTMERELGPWDTDPEATHV